MAQAIFVKKRDAPWGPLPWCQGLNQHYAHITDGRWIDEDRAYYVLHRVASDSTAHGVFAAIIDFCKSQSDNLRVDTHRDNAIMRRLLDRHGFTYCGIIYLSDGSERLAFQWLG